MEQFSDKPCPDCGGPVPIVQGGRRRCCSCAMRRIERCEPARRAVSLAIRRGDLVRQPCEVCGNPRVDGHHDDYSQPLKVRWLCRSHHQLHHAAEWRAGNHT